MATPAELLEQSLTALRNAKRFSAASQSYRKDNPAEYAKVIAYLDGGARPSGVTTEMGKHALLEEDARRALNVVDPPPPDGKPIPTSGRITEGGVYTGNYEGGTLRIETENLVHFSQALINSTGGDVFRGLDGGYTVPRLKLERCTISAGVDKLIDAEGTLFFEMLNCTINRTMGVKFTATQPGAQIRVLRNRVHNIQGSPNYLSAFFKVAEVQNSSALEVAWNEVINEYDKSHPEDLISLFKSANAKVHDNYLQHNSTPGNAYNTSSQGTITMDYPDGVGPLVHHNEIVDNIMVDTVNAILVPPKAHDNLIKGNRLTQDGKLPNGMQMGNGWSGYAMDPSAGANNRWEGNYSAYTNRDGSREDWWPMPQSVIDAQTTFQGTVTRQMELNEWTLWQAKLAAAGITVGA